MLGFAIGVWPSFFGQKKLFCKDDFTFNSNATSIGAAPCLIQAILIQFFSIALTLWWLTNIIKLYCVILYPKKWGTLFLRKGNSKNVLANRVEIGLNLGVWGFSLLTILFGLGFDTLGSGLGYQ